MKHRSTHRPVPGFTLIEMLVVISIIAILAGLILSAFPAVKRKAREAQARSEIKSIAGAISAYQALYGVYPAPSVDAQQGKDKTYDNTTYDTVNSNIMDILFDLPVGPNLNHQLNPQQRVFLNAKLTGDTTSAGLGKDNIFRDPWGRPYVITLDLNYDNNCKDTVYGWPPKPLLPVPVAVWSHGYDGLSGNPGQQKDDILSWK